MSNLKKIGIIAVIALIAFLLLSQPVESAGWVQHALGKLKDAAYQIVTFIKVLFS